MPCYKPLKGWRSRETNPETGKRSIVFKRQEGFFDMPEQIPCGQCIGCRLERSRQWATRCVHEASLYDDNNSFLTLTFSEENQNPTGTLVKADFQNFMKRLRKKFGQHIRYFHCGEYGEMKQRPHHHAIIFNHTFKDKEFYTTQNGNRLYQSETLDKLWGKGFALIGDVTFESAAYVARYCLKKMYSNEKNELIRQGNYKPDGRLNEYNTMSRRPGIGKGWYDKYKETDVYNCDQIVIRQGIICKPPKYYDSQYELDNIKKLRILKGIRKKKVQQNPDNRQDRLSVREKVKEAKAKKLRRTYETSNI